MIERIVRGAVAGVVGTAAMTVFMKPGVVGRLPSRWRPDVFVPRQVVQWAETMVGRPDALEGRAEATAAAVAHLGYGATMGALYGALPRPHPSVPPIARGAAWGVLVWAAGYQGWMPAAGVRPPTTQQPYTRWPVPIGNHLVFGMVTAAVAETLAERERRRRAIRIRL